MHGQKNIKLCLGQCSSSRLQSFEFPNAAQAPSLAFMTHYPCFAFPSVDLNKTVVFLIFGLSDPSLNNFFLLL
jgi:hypothetical protein